ncbi:alkaline phosphatase [Sphingorhabdus sp. Alg239-R122]|uniref:alkaline phosphatase n=1 Tax=Sphingorhabdus sp. Alg239-R122 TaxID=2305989 RepID=UPI0013DBB70A|nr:alkaline phosphatase [Sphingorhabdus sp. Alg239-R122]
MTRFAPSILAISALFLPLTACTDGSQRPVAAVSTVTPDTPAKAKNIILFIGDGMGISTVTAARIYEGQQRGETGEENYLSFERFPNVALVKTYNTNQQVPDSAGTATAINTGVKTRAGVIGTGPVSRRGDCAASQNEKLPSLAGQAKARGLAVGIVSTARLTHATPAAVYAHSPEREWEADSNLPEAAVTQGCRDIAAQLMEFPFDVALGGGRRNFLGQAEGGRRNAASANLGQQWAARTGGSYVEDMTAMNAAAQDKPVLGLFSSSHMTYMLDRGRDSGEPTLTDMTGAALQRVSRDDDGYFLMVEGGRIDHGHHDGKAGYALEEAREFARAVAYAAANTDPEETLILVTADHSHVFTIAGYPTRGNPILGLAMGNDDSGEPTGKPVLAADNLPYTTLGYANGPGAINGKRTMPETGPKAKQQAAIPGPYETHGGEDVALYVKGPGAAKARGVIEQNYIYNIMRTALGWPD